MTAVLTTALLAGPVEPFIVGPVLGAWGPRPILLAIAGQLLAALPFAVVALRGRAVGAPSGAQSG